MKIATIVRDPSITLELNQEEVLLLQRILENSRHGMEVDDPALNLAAELYDQLVVVQLGNLWQD